MLQLPATKPRLSTARSGPMKGVPKACTATCPVMRLGLQYEELVLKYQDAEHNDRDAEANLLRDQMDRIADRVSKIMPTSYEGAAFQVMLASAEIIFVRTGSTEEIKDDCRARAERLLYRAMDRIGYKNDDGWQVLRRWLLPAHVNCKTLPTRKGAR
jgi:hypothetical protein